MRGKMKRLTIAALMHSHISAAEGGNLTSHGEWTVVATTGMVRNCLDEGLACYWIASVDISCFSHCGA